MAISKRIELNEESNGIKIYISAPRHYSYIFFLPVWWIGWTVGGFTILTGILTQPIRHDTAFILLWLCFWLAGWVIVSYSWLWMVLGKEIVSLRGSLLAIKRDILGVGMTTRIPVAEISDFYIISGKPSLFSSARSWARLGLGWATLGVDWRGRTYRFGFQLGDEDADFLYDKIVAYVTETSNKSINRTRK